MLGSKSLVAPCRLVNIGNSNPVKLLVFITAIEEAIGIKAVKNLMPMQVGDVPATWADTTLLETLTGYKAQVNIQDGAKEFIGWYSTDYQNSS